MENKERLLGTREKLIIIIGIMLFVLAAVNLMNLNTAQMQDNCNNQITFVEEVCGCDFNAKYDEYIEYQNNINSQIANRDLNTFGTI